MDVTARAVGGDRVAGSYPLCPMQLGMLYHHLSDPEPGLDVEQIVCRLHEPLDAVRFRRAWDVVVARHDVLRTSFQWEEGDAPLQEVRASASPPFREEDWSDVGAGEQDARLERFLEEDRRTPFDLRRAPVMRFALFRRAAGDFSFVWTFHHIIVDGRAHHVVLAQVFDAYAVHQAGGEPPVTDQAPPFAEYIRWREGRSRTGEERYWRDLLRGFTTPVRLPAPVEPTAAGRVRRELVLSQTASDGLRDLVKRAGVTMNTVVQGAWALALHRFGSCDDVVFGATRACRRSIPGDFTDAVGVFINTLPVRARVSANDELGRWLRDIREQHVAVRPFEHTPLADVQRWSGIRGGEALFDTIVVFENATLEHRVRERASAWNGRKISMVEQTPFAWALYGYDEPRVRLAFNADRRAVDEGAVDGIVAFLRTLLEAMPAGLERPLSALPGLSDCDRARQLGEWNATAVAYDRCACVHELIEATVDAMPHRLAIAAGDDELTYRELDERANRLATHLRHLGVSRGDLVGICLESSIDMVVSLLGVLKAGGAYVPLDPAYPTRRLGFVCRDAGLRILVTRAGLRDRVPAEGVVAVSVDGDAEVIRQLSPERPERSVTADDLAYVTYTSGSTGKPKGVMVEHRNVVNLFTGMDAVIRHDPPGVWLAVTSLSFDISVVEVLWTLSRGFKVVLPDAPESRESSDARVPAAAPSTVDFSLFYFASGDGTSGAEQYRLLLEGAKFADEHGFAAVWTPERHFHGFGGPYPNPSVIAAALAVLTRRVGLRAGSCVLPLHHPIRVAEEWSVVDNLSGGRVGISFASGWHPNDFVLRPESFEQAKDVLVAHLDAVRRLWRGESICLSGPKGDVTVGILPRPIQRELPFWITSAGSPATFRLAGELGGGVLTHLFGQRVSEVAEKLRVYREAWRAAGHPGDGHVTLMLHTFVAGDPDFVREQVEAPLKTYLRSAASLIRKYATDYPAFKKGAVRGTLPAVDPEALSDEEMAELLEFSFARYYETSGLFGTPEQCLRMVRRLQEIGVDEIACLIDFGVPTDVVLRELASLDLLRRLAAAPAPARPRRAPLRVQATESLGALIRRHHVTHLQCTPSLAVALLADHDTREALYSLRQMLVGGEALPRALADELTGVVAGEVVNMYGPTETTVWSSCHVVQQGSGPVPIGRPIANTRLYVLDAHRRLVPVGVIGELYIAGDGVTRGYLGRRDLTAERFLQDPFSQSEGGMMYRSGDLGRFRRDGTVEFSGRLDDQVKLRGHRIEPSEIESVLLAHPGVREAVVVLREDRVRGDGLVAYYTGRDGPAPSPEILRAHAERELPDVMVPSRFVALASLPLTPNAKVDRAALPEPVPEPAAASDGFIAPRTGVERRLAALWKDLLGVERVGLHDNFFDLGGHSLLALTALSRIRKQFGYRFSPMDLARQSLGQLAAACEVTADPSTEGWGVGLLRNLLRAVRSPRVEV